MMARWMMVLVVLLLPLGAAAENGLNGSGSALKVASAAPADASRSRVADPGKSANMNAAELEIGAYRATYEVRYGGFKVGEMTQRLAALQNGQRSLETVAYTTGLASWLKSDKVVEKSIWSEKRSGPLPLSYTYRYSGQSKRVFEKLGFDWKEGIVSSLRDGMTVELPAEPGILDKHMYQIVMREDLLNGERINSYRVADRNKIKEYTFELVGSEAVVIEGFGELDCLKVRKGTTLLWLAKKFDYLPVKIEKEEGGSLASSHLISFKPG